MASIILPQLGEGIDKATVAYWHCQTGEHLNLDEDVVDVVTDKATFTVAATSKGILRSILAPEGQEVSVGQVLAEVESV
jgi:pyruvate/2-oxoglutarate dehydrogenase complex dihydrolipoamide acyltransferase (E2) component